MAGEIVPIDQEQFVGIVEEMRDQIVGARHAIEASVSGIAGKEQADALAQCSKDLQQAIATMERLEQRPQQDIEGRLDDILATLRRMPTRAPWWHLPLFATVGLLIGLGALWAVGVCLKGHPKTQLVMQAPACPEVPAPRRGGK